MGEGDPGPFRVLVVAPTYRNAGTLAAVLDALSETGLPTLVVDDGCDDGTPNVLRRWLDAGDGSGAAALGGGGRWVVTHPSNRGKAAALRSGFERAAAMGFTHAVTIDTDGQHDADDVAHLVGLARERPEALVVGARPTATRGYPAANRLGRWVSNALVRLESGACVSDSQCGLRVYPLGAAAGAGATAARYGFETEVIARLAWAGVPVVEAPVRCVYDVAGGRVSHFRPVRDSLQAVGIHARLLARSLLPWPVWKLAPRPPDGWETGTAFERLVRWMNPLTAWRRIRRQHAARERLAASMAVGIFMATVPAYGMKTVLCLLLAKWMRLQPLVVLAVSSLNTPPVGPVLAAASIVAGHLVLRGTWPAAGRYDPFRDGIWTTMTLVAAEWVVGGVVLGVALALLTYGSARLMMRAIPVPRSSQGTQPAPAPQSA